MFRDLKCFCSLLPRALEHWSCAHALYVCVQDIYADVQREAVGSKQSAGSVAAGDSSDAAAAPTQVSL